jgi:hypothetical protein
MLAGMSSPIRIQLTYPVQCIAGKCSTGSDFVNKAGKYRVHVQPSWCWHLLA